MKYLALLILLLAAPAYSATYHVAKTGNDSNTCTQAQSASTPKLTLDAGVQCLAGGDTLTIHAGTYDEYQASWASMLRGDIPNGSAGAPTVIKANLGDAVILKPSSASLYRAIFLSDNQQYITFDGLELDGSLATLAGGADGVKLTYGSDESLAASHVVLQNMNIHNWGADGILTTGGTDISILNSSIHNNGGGCASAGLCHGIYLGSGSSLIDGNDIYANAGYGIQLYDGSAFCNSVCVHDVVIRRNIVRGNNTDSNIYNAGITVWYGSNNLVYNNLVYGNTEGITTGPGGNSAGIYNNTIYGNTGGGNGGNCVLVNYAGSVLVKNNICNANTNDGIATANGGGFTGATNLFTTANFLNAAGSDFRLTAGSTGAIGTGTDLSAIFTTDYAGLNRAVWDIGAYAYGNPQLALSTTSTTTLGAITVTVSGGYSGTQEWVALYDAANPDSSFSVTDSAHPNGNWQYLNGTQVEPLTGLSSASLSFTAPVSPGTYNLRYFANNGYGTRLALSQNVTVSNVAGGITMGGKISVGGKAAHQ